MDAKRDGMIDWDEFINHLLLEFQEKEVEADPYVEPFTKRPLIIKSNHRHPVLRIRYAPFVKQVSNR